MTIPNFRYPRLDKEGRIGALTHIVKGTTKTKSSAVKKGVEQLGGVNAVFARAKSACEGGDYDLATMACALVLAVCPFFSQAIDLEAEIFRGLQNGRRR